MLTSIDARAVFETVVGKLIAKPENVTRAKALFVFFHEYEAQFGELTQITKLEQRMATLFPEDPKLHTFSQRYASPTFDPTTVHPIISPRTQMKPAAPPMIMPSIEEPLPAIPPQVREEQQRLASPVVNSPRVATLLPVGQSPKRPLEDIDDSVQPRKLARGESPLKGAAGRRLDAARRNMAATGAAAIPLPQGINFLLSIIPGAHTYRETRFLPDVMVNLLRGVQGIPLPMSSAGGQAPAGRHAATPSTAQQLASIQEKYGTPNLGHMIPPPGGVNAWGV